jgi:FlaG/FlaF family flagellin (archaellin)
MVAVAVVIAVSVAAFGFAFMNVISDPAPSASFEAVESDRGVAVVQVAGDEIQTDSLFVNFNDERVPATELTDVETISAGTELQFQPRGAETIELVWETESEDSAILYTIDSYKSTAVFEFDGPQPHSLDVSATETVNVSMSGPGGQSGSYTNRSMGVTDGGASHGGAFTGRLNVSEVDALSIYVGESPEATASNPVGGWGYLNGGAPYQTSVDQGGGGGGATAILADGTEVAIAHGGGGGAGWDTFTFYPGGGGGGGGDGGPTWFGGTGADGEGSGSGGDGAGGTDGGNEDSFISATPGGVDVVADQLLTETSAQEGGGAPPDQDGEVRITYTVGDSNE